MSPLILADEGVSQAVIVVSSEATAPEKHAARELANFLKQTTDAEFQIVDRYVENQTCLLVGGDAARWALPEFSTDALSPEELILIPNLNVTYNPIESGDGLNNIWMSLKIKQAFNQSVL